MAEVAEKFYACNVTSGYYKYIRLLKLLTAEAAELCPLNGEAFVSRLRGIKDILTDVFRGLHHSRQATTRTHTEQSTADFSQHSFEFTIFHLSNRCYVI